MKKGIMFLLALLVLIPSTVCAHEFEHRLEKELINSTDNGDETTTYEYAINLFSEAGESVSSFSFTITHKTYYSDAVFTPVGFTLMQSGPVSDVNDENTVYLYALRSANDNYRIYGGVNNKIGTYSITLSNEIDPDDAIELSIEGGSGSVIYLDENNYSLAVSDVNDLSEYTVELIVGSLVFDFNENFDGTFTWESHGESGIKINNLSSKAIRVAFDWQFNIEGLQLEGYPRERVSATKRADCLNYYNVYGLDRSTYPEEWHSNTYYRNAGLFTRVFFTDNECTIPLEEGSVYSSDVEYYFIDNDKAMGVSSYNIIVDAYDQNEYVYPGIDYRFELNGGSLEDVQRVQRGNKKIGTITVTIVGV